MGEMSFNTRGASPPLSYYFQPKQRLDTFLFVHSMASLVIGAVGFMNPTTAKLFFTLETDREAGVGRVLVRLLCCLVYAQGLIINRVRKIKDSGEVKRAVILAYFICFALSSLALVLEHCTNEGIVDGKWFGVSQIIVMLGLTGGYGWFTFFQPPVVFALGLHSS